MIRQMIIHWFIVNLFIAIVAAFVWKTREFYIETKKVAIANNYSMLRCELIAICSACLTWLLALGTFVVAGIALGTFGALIGGIITVIYFGSLFLLTIKLHDSMPIKPNDSGEGA